MNGKTQQLGQRNTHAPTSASQACSPATANLNREGTLSDSSLKTCSNILDENRQSGKTGQDLRVPVLNMRNQPLMPTTPGKARHLLDDGKAEVVKRKPFTIQLTYATGENKQDVKLGVDSGYKHIGFSAVTKNRELISGNVELRTDIPKTIEQRSNYRRNRRSRKWYRKHRFNNRKRREGWIPPSLRQKKDSHIRLVNQLKDILPISEVIVEVASFDIQKMQNPEINGIEYQQGTLRGYNIRNYLLRKFNHECSYCGKKDTPLEIEHIVPKSRGGTNRVSNLTISCHDCNQKKGRKTAEEFGYPDIQKQAKKSLKEATFMNVVRWKIANELDCKHTFGHITKKKRIEYNIEKSHINDAFVIAGGNNTHIRSISFEVYRTRRNNRSIQTNRKGHGRSIRKQRYALQPKDLVEYDGKECIVKGVFNYGKWLRLKDKDGKTINSNIKNVKVIKYGKGFRFK